MIGGPLRGGIAPYGIWGLAPYGGYIPGMPGIIGIPGIIGG
jgi:hypothetical protein|tara:strand:- start:221 stop:343 length:123 start_codon:yes stop_codon:yes gene_type:complete